MKSAVLVTPPLIPYLAGPPAGPAVLKGAAHMAGHELRLVDLNAAYLHSFDEQDSPDPSLTELTGDHAKPAHRFSAARRAWQEMLSAALGTPEPGHTPGEDPVLSMCFSHAAVLKAAHTFATGTLARHWKARLEGPRPHFLGLSLLWSGQVVAALAVASLARSIWPGVPVIFGGPHVTALAGQVAQDATYGELVDGFVAGYAEGTLAHMMEGDPRTAEGVFSAGDGSANRGMERWSPAVFEDLSLYGVPHLVLPAQTSRGCAYGRCSFCTYASQEGCYRIGELERLEPIVRLAAAEDADLSIKDAYLLPGRLDQVASLVAGRVHFAACTRVAPGLARSRFERWVAGGLRTLEFGVETLDPRVLRMVDKRQGLHHLEAILEAAAGLPLHLVLNVIFGWPGQTLRDALACLSLLTEVLPARFPHSRFSVEGNLLQICQGAPLAEAPLQWGIRRTRSWPWSTVLGWDAPRWRAQHGHLFRGHRPAANSKREAA